jgi:hypothetical protein
MVNCFQYLDLTDIKKTDIHPTLVSTSLLRQLLKRIQGIGVNNLIDHNFFLCIWWQAYDAIITVASQLIAVNSKQISSSHSKSISNAAHYVILHSTIGWRKIKMCGFRSGNCFWLSIITQSITVAGKRRSTGVHLQKRV